MSEPSLVITIDIGGSAAKAYAFDVVERRAVGQASMAYPEQRSGVDPGSFDPDEWFAAAVRALGLLVTKLGVPESSYLGVTVSAIRIPFVLIDEQGEPVGPSLLNKDRRALHDVTDVVTTVGAKELYELTGHFGAPEFGLAKLLWLRRVHRDAWDSAATVLQLHDWIIYRLSGAKGSEPSSAAMSQMLDVAHGCWATDVLDSFGFPHDRFPELRKAGTQIGGLINNVAIDTGLPPGLPVHVGGGDTHLSAISAGKWDPYVPVLVAGTTAPIHLTQNFIPAADDRFPLLLSEHALSDRWTLESNAGATGGIVGRLIDLGDLTGPPLEEALVRRGFVVDDSVDTPLTVISGNPFFGPEGWAHLARPTVLGLRPSHRGDDVFVAALQGGAQAIRSVLSTLVARLPSEPSFIRMTGGMSENLQWCQTIADTTGVEVRVRPIDQVAGLAGAALVVGEELVSATEQIREAIYPPTLASSQRQEKYETFLDIYSMASQRTIEEGVATDAGAR